jgi:multisubunit Na+/H+ antiporter MnhG subunit
LVSVSAYLRTSSVTRQRHDDSQADEKMTIGTSLFLIAVGAILKWAVTWTVAGIDLHVAGVILIIVGVVGLLIGLAMLFSDRPPWQRVPPDRYPPPPPEL